MIAGLSSLARERPDQLALVDGARTLTWAQLDKRVNRLSQVLLSAGLGPGRRLAILMGNRAEFVEVQGACLQTGTTYVPINWHLSADEIAYILDDCDATGLIVDNEQLGVASAIAQPARLHRRLVTGSADKQGFGSYEVALAQSPPDPVALDVPPGGPMLYTSGTTGRPKGVERSAAPVGTGVGAVLAAYQANPWSIGFGGTHLITGPMYHVAPGGIGFLALNLGNTVVIMQRWSPEEALQLMTRWQVSNTFMVPTMFVRLLRLPDDVRSAFDPRQITSVVHGAAPCPVWVKQRMIEWWGPVFYESYGGTEGGTTLTTSKEWLKRPGSVGRAVQGYTIEIRGDDGSLLPAGEVGTIYFRASTAQTFRYFKDEAKTGEAHAEPGVFTLGDVGSLDAEGYLYLSDRKIDLIISGGMNVYPAEIEETLLIHPAVTDAAVFGIPNEDWGEEVKAAIQLTAGHEAGPAIAAELSAFCRERLAHYKCPRSIDFLDELPRSAAGKLRKRILREPYWAYTGRSI